MRPTLRRYARYLLRNRGLKGRMGESSLLQETFVAAIEGFPHFHGNSVEEMARWLERILVRQVEDKRKALEADKRDIRRDRPLTEDVARNLPAPAQEVGARSDWDRDIAKRAFHNLPEQYQKVLNLKFKDDLSFNEIGASLGCSENDAFNLFNRAFECLTKEADALQEKRRLIKERRRGGSLRR